jgi:hypothetical protein
MAADERRPQHEGRWLAVRMQGWGHAGRLFDRVKSVISRFFRCFFRMSRFKNRRVGAAGLQDFHGYQRFCTVPSPGDYFNRLIGLGYRARGFLAWMSIAAFASHRRGHATKCLLRRQTESQRDFVHHRRVARKEALDMTTPHPQSLSPLRGEGSQWRCGQNAWTFWLRA